MNELTTLPDGTKIDRDGVVVEQQSLPRVFVPTSHKVTQDLPANFRAFALVSALEVWGLTIADIAEALDRGFEDIKAIQQSEGYLQFRSEMIDGALEAETNDVRQIFVAASARAARGVVQLLDSVNPDARTFAMKETLDRGGFRPVDIVEHRIKHENDLRIIYTKDDKSKLIEGDSLGEL